MRLLLIKLEGVRTGRSNYCSNKMMACRICSKLLIFLILTGPCSTPGRARKVRMRKKMEFMLTLCSKTWELKTICIISPLKCTTKSNNLISKSQFLSFKQ